MSSINEIVQQALNSGYLGLDTQNEIQTLLQSHYDSEDVDALIILQRAIASGNVEREPSCRYQTYFPVGSQQSQANIKLAYQVAAEMTFAVAVAMSMQNNTQNQPFLGR
ncbi:MULTISPECIES: hypothetical protein [unclassified Anabaena]|uniref:hypothetical protein n=1 Tax=unclassified Anabaena TaxID=2619674 RepID=UPI0008327749|nr:MULTISPECIES: hypothetical protein [unclassified Anabaena]